MSLELPVRELGPFCRNLEGRVAEDNDRIKEAAFIQRDELAAAFVNPFQSRHGAVLVVPTRHAPTILDLNDTGAEDEC